MIEEDPGFGFAFSPFFRANPSAMLSGYWGPVTSSVDFCETNYEVSPFLAEFWNAISSLAMFFIGFLGIFLHPWAEKRFKLAFVSIMIVGLGSLAFHGTLVRATQAWDELPMLISTNAFVFILADMRHQLSNTRRRIVATGIVLLTIIQLTAHVLEEAGPRQFIVFAGTWMSSLLYCLYHGYGIYRDRIEASRASGVVDPSFRLYRYGMLLLAGAGISWLTDMLSCQYLNPTADGGVSHHHASRGGWVLPVNPQLHAFWHCLISTGLYVLIIILLNHRTEQNGYRSRIVTRFWVLVAVQVEGPSGKLPAVVPGPSKRKQSGASMAVPAHVFTERSALLGDAQATNGLGNGHHPRRNGYQSDSNDSN